MKNIIFITILFTIILSQDTTKTNMKHPKAFDLKKGINLGNIVPNPQEMDPFYTPLTAEQIEEVIKTASDYTPSPVSTNDIVTLETTMGVFKMRLFPKVAPKHCENFKKLANSGFYDGTTFHRVIPGFMIQGGDILSRDTDRGNDGTGGPGWTISAEFNKTPHKRGTLSMARGQSANSAGSQFFICVADASYLDNNYTVFGEVIENIEVIDRIVNTATDHTMAMAYFKNQLPKGADPEKWITVQDPKTRQYLYAPIPGGESKSSFTWEMQKKLQSDNPVMPVRMIKVRVESVD